VLLAGSNMTTFDAPIVFGLLGPLLVKDRDGTAIPIPQAKLRIVMAALLLKANTTVSSAQLAEALWENQAPPNASATIRTYVARLRRILGPRGTRLVSRPSGYTIEVPEAAELDLGRLERLRSQLREASDARHWEQVILTSGEGLDLWRGMPLEDIPSSALCRSVGAGLDELRLQFLTSRIDAELFLGQEHHVVAELRQLADEHPLREHIQARLALAYYRCGRQAEALEVCLRARAHLVDELAIEPGPELRQLYQHILTANPVLDSTLALSSALSVGRVPRDAWLRVGGRVIPQRREIAIFPRRRRD
jgi:DNA-binding SARP family transcriptional activator